jgi:hypothetical protein
MLLELLKKEFWNMELLEKKKGAGGKKKKKKEQKNTIQGSGVFGGENLPKCQKKKGGLMKALLEKKWI